MRIFQNFPQAISEIRRDLKEMGIPHSTKSYQNLPIKDEGDQTLELQNYIYTVTDPDLEDLKPDLEWCEAEWLERVDPNFDNPGEAWKLRRELWEPMLNEHGEMDYTYSNRLNRDNQIGNVVKQLENDPGSRQLFISMWDPEDSHFFGIQRVPCSLGWHFMYRREQLDMTYFMRSCDFSEHFQNDLWLSRRLQLYVAERAGLMPGNFTHYMSSLHVYNKDVEDVF